jgi:hypothetical protein
MDVHGLACFWFFKIGFVGSGGASQSRLYSSTPIGVGANSLVNRAAESLFARVVTPIIITMVALPEFRFVCFQTVIYRADKATSNKIHSVLVPPRRSRVLTSFSFHLNPSGPRPQRKHDYPLRSLRTLSLETELSSRFPLI